MPHHATSVQINGGAKHTFTKENSWNVLETPYTHSSSNNSNSHNSFLSQLASHQIIDHCNHPFRIIYPFTFRKPYCPPCSCNRWESLVLWDSWQINQLHCPGTDPVVGCIGNRLCPLPNRQFYLYCIQKKSGYSNSSVATGRAKKRRGEAAAAFSHRWLQPPIPKPIDNQLTTDQRQWQDWQQKWQKTTIQIRFWLFLFYFCCFYWTKLIFLSALDIPEGLLTIHNNRLLSNCLTHCFLFSHKGGEFSACF